MDTGSSYRGETAGSSQKQGWVSVMLTIMARELTASRGRVGVGPVGRGAPGEGAAMCVPDLDPCDKRAPGRSGTLLIAIRGLGERFAEVVLIANLHPHANAHP